LHRSFFRKQALGFGKNGVMAEVSVSFRHADGGVAEDLLSASLDPLTFSQRQANVWRSW